MRRLLFLLMLVPTVAWAEPAVPPASDSASIDTSKPRSKGPAHICRTNYPPRAFQRGEQGVTVLAFEVSAMGTVRDLIVMSSSGSLDLDLAATKCVSKWQYEPALKNGVPIAVPWFTDTIWRIMRSGEKFNRVIPEIPKASCVKPDTASNHLDAINRISVVRYALVSGTVAAATLTGSSGDRALDNEAVGCVKSWQFKNAFEDGRPATGEFMAIIDWTQRTLP